MRLGLFLSILVGCPTATPTEPEPAPAPEPVAEPEPEPEAPAARVFFKAPADGATVKSPVRIEFGVEGMEIKPAGEIAENTGHHHLIVGPAGVAQGETVPTDDKHIHYGLGQTEADIELPAGEHKLTMQFADGNHSSYGDVMAATITITVEE
ncbi:MAG: DUF4399 domain-containing protein [Myxococcales bacterium]|nr:DUF4399 domain-containing protein [Myxococcales bacterium]